MTCTRLHAVVHLVVLALSALACGADDGTSETAAESSTTSKDASTGKDSDDATSTGTGAGEACAPSGVSETEATQTVDAASVTASATLLNALGHCAKNDVSIELVLDTHSVDLLAYDLTAVSRLETSSGVVIEQGFRWEAGSESGHHREGILRVEAPPLAGVDWLRLTLPELAGVDRVFEWKAELLAHDLP